MKNACTVGEPRTAVLEIRVWRDASFREKIASTG
jgi:hypothetical protein